MLAPRLGNVRVFQLKCDQKGLRIKICAHANLISDNRGIGEYAIMNAFECSKTMQREQA